jgi:hypothetical protein
MSLNKWEKKTQGIQLFLWFVFPRESCNNFWLDQRFFFYGSLLNRKRCAGEPSSSYCALHRVDVGSVFIFNPAKRLLFRTKNFPTWSLGTRVTWENHFNETVLPSWEKEQNAFNRTDHCISCTAQIMSSPM